MVCIYVEHGYLFLNADCKLKSNPVFLDFRAFVGQKVDKMSIKDNFDPANLSSKNKIVGYMILCITFLKYLQIKHKSPSTLQIQQNMKENSESASTAKP